MKDRTLVTGFRAFEGCPVNPSALLASSCGRPHAQIEVAYDAVDRFLDTLDAGAYDRVLMLGVRRRGTRIEAERLARNHVCDLPDVRGRTRGPGLIAAGGPELIQRRPACDCPGVHASDDSGAYLCNYIFFEALRRLPPAVSVGFIHVPPVEVVALPEQQAVIARILSTIEAAVVDHRGA